MIISAKKYYTKIFKECIEKTHFISKYMYHLITPYESLHKFIDQDIIDEIIETDDTFIDHYVEEVFYNAGLYDRYLEDCTHIDTDYKNIIYNTIDLIYKQEFIYDKHDMTFCKLTRI